MTLLTRDDIFPMKDKCWWNERETLIMKNEHWCCAIKATNGTGAKRLKAHFRYCGFPFQRFQMPTNRTQERKTKQDLKKMRDEKFYFPLHISRCISAIRDIDDDIAVITLRKRKEKRFLISILISNFPSSSPKNSIVEDRRKQPKAQFNSKWEIGKV